MLISRKLMAGLAIMCLFVIVSGIIGIVYTGIINQKMGTVTHITTPAVEDVNKMIIALWKSNNLLQEHALEGRLSHLEAYEYELEEVNKEFNEGLKGLQKVIKDENILANIKAAASIQEELQNQANNLINIHRRELSATGIEETIDLKDSRMKLAEKIEQTTDEASLILEEIAIKLNTLNKSADEESFKTVKQIRWILMLTTIISMFASFFIWAYLKKTIIQPINRLSEGADQIALGKFDLEIKKTESNDEFDDLIDTFNQTTKSLKNMIEESPRMKKFLDLKTAKENMHEKEYHLETRVTYLIEEQQPQKVYELASEGEAKGKKVLCITRTSPTILKERFGLEKAEFILLSESKDAPFQTVANLESIMRSIKMFTEKHKEGIILIDRLDYIIKKFKFEATLNTLTKLNDMLLTKEHTLLLTLDPAILNAQELVALRKECKSLEGKANKQASEELILILAFIKNQKTLGKYVSFKDIGRHFNITAPTTQKKVMELYNLHLIHIIKQGRNKLIELKPEAYRHLK